MNVTKAERERRVASTRKATSSMRDGLSVAVAEAIDLVEMVAANGPDGMTSADITRLTGGNKYHLLRLAEKHGCLRSNPTGRRDRGRRWYAPGYYPGEL